MTPFNKHIWVVNILLEAGERGLSFKEINERWMRTDQSFGNPISRQTFDRWKNDILCGRFIRMISPMKHVRR